MILSLFVALPIYFSIFLFMFYFFGLKGIYVYTIISIIAANLQVLKVVHFAWFASPVALGTVLFSSSFLATDLVNELYGKKEAQKLVALTFFSYLFWTIILMMTLGYAPLTETQAGQDYAYALNIHSSMQSLFSFSPAIFLASICAYLVSQFFDVYIFSFIKKKMKNKLLFVRNNISTMLSGLIDNTVFSIVAFVILMPLGLSFADLVFTFILGTYILRVFIALLDTPFLYLAVQIGKLRQNNY